MMHRRFPHHNARKSQPRRVRPRLEMLEDRTAPAVLVVTSTADTSAADGQLTLREAIEAANSNISVDGSPAGEATQDTIVFAATLQGQTITLGGTELLIGGGGDLSIIGPGGVKSGITVDGNDTSRVFSVIDPTASVTLMNLTITGGNVGGADDTGGGLFNRAPNTTLANVLVTGNSASGDNADGGGIAMREGGLILDNTEVSGNTASDTGGGIWLAFLTEPGTAGQVTIRNGSRISSNRAGAIEAETGLPSSGRSGGGIWVGGEQTVLIQDSTIADNLAGSGGGISIIGGPVTVEGSTITGNKALTGDGGGITQTLGDTILRNSTLAYNIAQGAFVGTGGGGVSAGGASSTMTIVNSTIVGNADTSNLADGGGGISATAEVTLNVYNSIIALNGAGPSTTGGTPDRNYDVAPGLFDDSATNFIGVRAGDLANSDGDPRLGPLQDNGGPTLTFLPIPGSPVIGAGTNDRATEDGSTTGTPLTTDQRGTGFPRIIGGTVDQGAVERFSSSTTVTLAVLQDGVAVTGTSTARPVTLMATVASSTTGITPTGSVNFYRDPTPTDLTDEPVLLNSTPIALDDMGMASLPNVPLPSTSGLFARFVPSSNAFDPSASAQQTITATIRDTVGVYDPNAVYQLLNQNTTTTTGPDFGYSFGLLGDQPVVGNWTGSTSQVALPGVARPVSGLLKWTLADENPPVLPNLPSFNFGNAGQIPVAGDWDGDGTDGIGVYDPASGQWQLRNSPTGSGGPDFTFAFGGTGFLPVVGDWNGDGIDTVGVYEQATGQWTLAGNNPATGFPTPFGTAFTFNPSMSMIARPVAGDWDGDGTDGIGVFFPQTGANAGFGGFLLKQTASAGAPDVNGGNVILAGLDFWLPVSGNWGVAPTTSNELLTPSPLMLGEGGVPGGQSINALQLQSLVDGALGRLASVDADPAVLNALIETQFVLADLPGSTLGLADVANGRVLIDVDGAGAGWFVDGTPWEDSEFASGPVAGVDLLTAVLHEMGHVAGHGHDADGLMASSLSAGVRHTDALDALFGSGLGEPGSDPAEVAIP